MDLLSEYRDLYYKEIEHYDRLNGKVSNNLVLLSAVGAGIIFLYQEMFPFVYNIAYVFFALALLLASISFVIAVTLFCKAYIGYSYQYFPIKDMYNLIEANLEYAELSGDTVKKKVEENISKKLEDSYIYPAIHNRRQNYEKMKTQRIFTYLIIISFVLIAVTFVVWVVLINPYNEEIYNVVVHT